MDGFGFFFGISIMENFSVTVSSKKLLENKFSNKIIAKIFTAFSDCENAKIELSSGKKSILI